LEYATTEGVVLCPSALVTIVGFPPSIAATAEFVVPRSIPTTFSATTLNLPFPFPLRPPPYLCTEEDEDFTRNLQPLKLEPFFNPAPKKEEDDEVLNTPAFLLASSPKTESLLKPFVPPATPKTCEFTAIAAIA
jgi:hypothetical protein